MQLGQYAKMALWWELIQECFIKTQKVYIFQLIPWQKFFLLAAAL